MNELDDKQGINGGLRELALFAGAGGGILGGKLLGWKTICAVEFDPYAASVLAARQNDGILKAFPIWDNVCTFDGKPWRGRVDVVSGGFPCQDVSVAGRGAGLDGDRSGLWSEMFRIACEVRPRKVYVENSPALTVRGLGRVIGDLASVGYDCKWGVVSCRDVGGVHLRERIWIVATDNWGKRVQTGIKQKVYRFSRFPWGEDVRGIEDLRNRSDLPEPLIQRASDGFSFGMERLKALGNAQVPRVAATAFNILNG